MTTLALNQVVREAPVFLQRLGQRCSAFLDGITEARAMANRYETLSRLSDAQLAQYGLKREQIPQAVLTSLRHR
jgi:uncharacterized protein YjiS (DUF1127 family)